MGIEVTIAVTRFYQILKVIETTYLLGDSQKGARKVRSA